MLSVLCLDIQKRQISTPQKTKNLFKGFLSERRKDFSK